MPEPETFIYRGFECYRNVASGEWRWRRQAENNRIVANGGEGWASKSAVMGAVDTVIELIEASPPPEEPPLGAEDPLAAEPPPPS